MSGEAFPAVDPAGEPIEKVSNNAEVETVLGKYEDLKLASEFKLDQFWVWPEDNRPDPSIAFNFELPIVDLSPVLKLRKLQNELEQSNGQVKTVGIEEDIKTCLAAKKEVEKEIRAACEEYGFFQIINHGFPMGIVDRLKQTYIQLYGLPLEVKMKVSSPWLSRLIGYDAKERSNPLSTMDSSHIWHEGFLLEGREVMYPGATDEIASTLWPEEPRTAQQWRSTVEEYREEASSLSLVLLDLMADSLGLPEGSVQEFLGYGPESQVIARLAVNHYPVCPEPELTWGLHGHTDPSVITLLHQDEVGGLQIGFKDETWHGVRPIPGAFVINTGDFCQAWTNGRFVSAKHQVVASKESARYSIAYFVHTERETVTRPRPELVDNEHPLQYRPFSWQEYVQAIYSGGLNVTSKEHFLDRAFRAENQA